MRLIQPPLSAIIICTVTISFVMGFLAAALIEKNLPGILTQDCKITITVEPKKK